MADYEEQAAKAGPPHLQNKSGSHKWVGSYLVCLDAYLGVGLVHYVHHAQECCRLDATILSYSMES